MIGQKVVTIDQYRGSLDTAPTPHEEFDAEKLRASMEQEKGSTHVLFWIEADGDDHIYHREFFGSFESALAKANENQGIKTQ